LTGVCSTAAVHRIALTVTIAIATAAPIIIRALFDMIASFGTAT
jgi:hypothetical protein